MSMDMDGIVTDLRDATRLVEEASTGRMPLETFIERYNNFFYTAALDGHEGDPRLAEFIRSHPELVKIHEAVQRDVVDAVYLAPSEELQTIHAPGRISPGEATQRLQEIASSYDLESLLQKLPRT